MFADSWRPPLRHSPGSPIDTHRRRTFTMSKSDQRPADCPNDPACPSLHACRRYHDVADRQIAMALMTLDTMLETIQRLHDVGQDFATTSIDDIDPSRRATWNDE